MCRLWRFEENGDAVDALRFTDTFALCERGSAMLAYNMRPDAHTALIKAFDDGQYDYIVVWNDKAFPINDPIQTGFTKQIIEVAAACAVKNNCIFNIIRK